MRPYECPRRTSIWSRVSFYSALFVLKGIYHYWKYYVLFSRGINQMEEESVERTSLWQLLDFLYEYRPTSSAAKLP